MRVILLVCFIACLYSCNSDSKCTPIEYSSKIYKFNSDIIDKLEDSPEDWKYQIAASEFATKGNYYASLRVWDVGRPKRQTTDLIKKDSINFYSNYQAVDAIEYISEAAKTKQIVIINEAHHNPKNRVFTRTLLSGLVDLGFTHIGFETLNVKDTLLNQRKYPIISSGSYSVEPQFGNLIRDALQFGLVAFSYEAEAGKNGKYREIEQAQNIMKVLDADPKARIIIHCGYAHVYKGEYKSWGKTMAGRLFEYSGIEPLTIDQQVHREKSSIEYESRNYTFQNVEEATVFIDSLGVSYKLLRNKDFVDIVVFHERISYIHNRPHWIFDHEYKLQEIDLSDYDFEYPIMVAAFDKNENLHSAVPIDFYELGKNETIAYLSLKKGDYNILVIGKSETCLITKSFH